MFGSKPKKTRTPLMAGDHPEKDLSEFCDQDQIKRYQTIVGLLNWLSGLGRFDIAVCIMTMSRFRQQRRIGLKDSRKSLATLPTFPMDLYDSDFMNQTTPTYHIGNMISRGLFKQEQKKKSHIIFQNLKGKHVTTTTYVDANLHHDQVTGRAVTACLHLVNATLSH